MNPSRRLAASRCLRGCTQSPTTGDRELSKRFNEQSTFRSPFVRRPTHRRHSTPFERFETATAYPIDVRVRSHERRSSQTVKSKYVGSRPRTSDLGRVRRISDAYVGSRRVRRTCKTFVDFLKRPQFDNPIYNVSDDD